MPLHHDVLTVIFSFIETYEEYVEYYTLFKLALSNTTFKNIIHTSSFQNIDHYNLPIETNKYNSNVNIVCLDVNKKTFDANDTKIRSIKTLVVFTTDVDNAMLCALLDRCKEIEYYSFDVKAEFMEPYRNKVVKVNVTQLLSSDELQRYNHVFLVFMLIHIIRIIVSI